MTVQEDWIEAIYENRLAELDQPIPRAACTAIGARMRHELADIERWLGDGGITAQRSGDVATGAPSQRHSAELLVADADAARAAAVQLAGHGFQVWEATSGAAGEIHARFRSVLTLARTTDVTVAVRVRWPSTGRRVPPALLPNRADADFVDLPAGAWPLAFVLRPIRLAVERIGLRRPGTPVLGPFLSTPTELVPALLEFGEVSSTDTVADLGCGDGRIVIEAAKRTGCRAIGVESDPELVARAQARAREAGVSDRIRILEGDATNAELGQATTVFVFLPADTTVPLVRSLLDTLDPGTRIIAHEQHRLTRAPEGCDSRALIAGEGVTVAHQWIVGR